MLMSLLNLINQPDPQLNAKQHNIHSPLVLFSFYLRPDSISLVCQLQWLSASSCLFRASVIHVCAGLHVILLKIHTIPVGTERFRKIQREFRGIGTHLSL